MTQKLLRDSFSVLILYDPQRSDEDLVHVRTEIAAIKSAGRLKLRFIAPSAWPTPSSSETGEDTHVGAPHVHCFKNIHILKNDKDKLDEIEVDLKADLNAHRKLEQVFGSETVGKQILRLAIEIESGKIPKEHAKLGLMQAVLLPGVTDFSELRAIPKNGYVPRSLLQRDITYLKTLHSLHGKAGDDIRESLVQSKNISSAVRAKKESVEAFLKTKNAISWDPEIVDGQSGLQKLWDLTIKPDLAKLYEVVNNLNVISQTPHVSPKDIIQLIGYSLSGEANEIDLNLIQCSNEIALAVQRSAGRIEDNHLSVYSIEKTTLNKLGIDLEDNFITKLFEHAFILQVNLILLAHFLSLLVLKYDRCQISEFDLAKEIARFRNAASKTIAPIVNASNSLIWLYVDSARLMK